MQGIPDSSDTKEVKEKTFVEALDPSATNEVKEETSVDALLYQEVSILDSSGTKTSGDTKGLTLKVHGISRPVGEKTFGDTEGLTRNVDTISRRLGRQEGKICEAARQDMLRAWKEHSGWKCEVCGESDKHPPPGFNCPYLTSCPKNAIVGRGYGVICRICGLPAGHHPDSNFWAGRAHIMICYHCNTRQQHWTDDCPSPKRLVSWSDWDWTRSRCIPAKDHRV